MQKKIHVLMHKTKEDRKADLKRKELREKLLEQYGTAILDGEKVSCILYAEPSIQGSGAHFRGKWKRRITHLRM